MHAVRMQASELFAAANQTASEAFAAIRTVAAFSLQEQLGSLYEKLLEKPQACTAFVKIDISMPHIYIHSDAMRGVLSQHVQGPVQGGIPIM